MAVGDGNHVGRDVRGDVTGLCFDDGQSRQGAAAFHEGFQCGGQIVHVGDNLVRFNDLGGALQQAGVEVEDIAGVGLASGRTAEQQGDLAVSHSLFGEVIVDDEGMTAGVAEVLADGGTGERSVELHGRGVRGGGGHHDGVGHSPALREGLHQRGHGGTFLSHSHINAVDGIAFVVERLLVDNGVDGDGGLAGLAVADDKLTLAAADGDHGVDGLDAGLQRSFHGLAEDDAGGLALDGQLDEFAFDVALAVNGLAEGVYDAAQQAFADFDGGDAAGALADVAFVQRLGVAQKHDTHIVLFQVEGDAGDFVAVSGPERHQFAGLDVMESVNAGNAVADQQHGAHLFHFGLLVEIFKLLTQYGCNF